MVTPRAEAEKRKEKKKEKGNAKPNSFLNPHVIQQ